MKFRKILPIVLSILLIACPIFAEFGGLPFGTGEFGGAKFNVGVFGESGISLTTLEQMLVDLEDQGNLTFAKIYEELDTGTVTAAQLAADFSVGAATATYTSARSASAPATYVDDNGVVQLVTTANVGRIQGGYYDATGFHAQKGLMIEAAGTNLITKSNNVEDAIYTKTNVTADNDDAGSSSPDGTATAPSLTATANDGTFLLASGVTARTYSVFIKRKTGTGTISITADSGATYEEVTVIAGWARFQVTAASASQTCGIKLGTSGDAVYVWTNQFENDPYMTSPIITTTAALTRPSDVLKYAIAGNRTAATESIFIKFAPTQDYGLNDGSVRYLLDNDTKRRVILSSGTVKHSVRPNTTDNSSVLVSTSIAISKNISYVCAYIFQHASPYIQTYNNNVNSGNYTAGDWTNNAWGTNFILGANSYSSAEQLSGIIQSVAIYSTAKDSTAVGAITGILQ